MDGKNVSLIKKQVLDRVGRGGGRRERVVDEAVPRKTGRW